MILDNRLESGDVLTLRQNGQNITVVIENEQIRCRTEDPTGKIVVRRNEDGWVTIRAEHKAQTPRLDITEMIT